MKTIMVLQDAPPCNCMECYAAQIQPEGGYRCKALDWYVNDEDAAYVGRPVWCPILKEMPKYKNPYEIPGDEYHMAFIDGYNQALAERCIGEYECNS